MRPNWFIAWPASGDGWFERHARPPHGIRRFHPEDLHVTLAFLGPVEEAAARAAWAACGRPPARRATLGTVVPMGRPDRYTALSALLDEGRADVEADMGRHRRAACEAASVAPDRRSPKAHLTLARPGRRAGEGERAAGLAWARTVDLSGVPLTLDRLALYTWSEDRRDRLFRVVEEVRLVG